MRKILFSFYKITLISTLLILSNIFSYANPVRIMPLGDSITHGYPHGYRSYLWYKLQDAQYSVDFVGSQDNGYLVTPSFDTNHEGYGGWMTYDIANIVYGLLVDNPPDIILLHIGSNDVSPTQGLDSSSISGLEDILNEIDIYERDYHHSIRVILATIINRREYHQTVRDYNRNLINLAQSRIRNGDKITLVDMEYGAGLNVNDYGDATHPDGSGYYKMSNVWFDALNTLLLSIPSTPTQLTSTSVEYTSATLSWQDNSSNENGFKIYQNNTLIAILPSNTTSYNISGLKSRETYTFTVKAYSEGSDSAPINIVLTTKDDFAWLVPIYHAILN